MDGLKIIVGLGNPGRAYLRHRHNIGFRAIDCLSKRFEIEVNKKLFQARIGLGGFNKDKVLLVKPQAYMNLSGNSVSPILGYYKCSLKDLIVIHDDMDLEFGRIKVAYNAGHGGHNGIRSIGEQLGSKEFYRIRVGIGKPSADQDPSIYVLSDFNKEEALQLDDILEKIVLAAENLILNGLEDTQQKFN